MNILQLSPLYSPVVGGAETHVRSLAEKLVERGHSVLVVTDKCHVDYKKVEYLGGVKIIRVSSYGKQPFLHDKVTWEKCYFGIFREISRVVGKWPIDIIHAQCHVSGIIGAVLKENIGCPLIFSSHETMPEDEPCGSGISRFIHKYLPVDAFCVGSEYFRRQAICFGASQKKTKLIYMGVNIAKFSDCIINGAFRKKIEIPRSDFLITMIGRFKKRKGQIDLIRALPLILKSNKNIHCVLVGSCNAASVEYFTSVKNTIRELRLESHVTILNSLSWEEIPYIIKISDVVVQPSHREGLCLALIEAMASRKPVVATDIEGIKEVIIHDHNGLLVQVNNPEAIARAILFIFSNKKDAHRLAESAFQTTIQKFNIERTSNETLELYNEMLRK